MRSANRTRNVVFLLSVGLLALVFAVDVVSRAVPRDVTPATAAPAGAGGDPRDVDVDRLRRLIRQGHLSDHEAEFARPADEPPPDDD